MVLVALLLCTNVFLWTLSQNTLYNEAVKERNQLEVDRLNERVKAFNATYTVNDGEVSVSADLQNQGPLSVQITNLWVKDIDKDLYNCSGPLDELNLEPGGASTLEISVTITGSEGGDRFSSWLITGRGNVVPIQEKEIEEIIVANLAQGIGSMALDFLAFKYFTYQTSTKLANYPDGTNSFNVPSRTNIAFGVKLTNLDPIKQPIRIDKYSQCWLYFPKAPGQSTVFYVVNVADDGTITTPYSPITIPFKETKLIVFASNTAGSLARVFISSSVEDLPCALNLLLLGTIGTRDYGQNIPFVSLYVYKP